MTEQNKKIILSLLILMLIISLLSIVSLSFIVERDNKGINCQQGLEGLCIEIEINSYSDEFGLKKENLGYPSSYRHGDYLRIDEIKIFNNEGDLPPFYIHLDFFPYQGHILYGYSADYGELQLISVDEKIGKEDVYTIKRNKFQSYNHFLNSNFIKSSSLHSVELYKTGEWVFRSQIELKQEPNSSWGHTIIKNGRWMGNVFLVNPKHEIDALKENKRIAKIAIITLIAIVVLSIFQLWKKEFENIIFKKIKIKKKEK